MSDAARTEEDHEADLLTRLQQLLLGLPEKSRDTSRDSIERIMRELSSQHSEASELARKLDAASALPGLANDELQQKARLNQILLDSIPCMALLLRPETREIVASNAAAQAVGAVPGKTCFGTWGRSETPCPWCRAPEVWATSQAQHIEVEGLGRVWDAHWVPVSEDLYLHYAFDITERKREEAQRTHLLMAIEQASETVAVTDTHGIIQYANPAFARMAGCTCEEAVGQRQLSLENAQEDDSFRHAVRTTLERGDIWQGRVTNKRTDGALYEQELAISPVRNAEGGIVSYVSVGRDVTLEADLERQLSQAQRMETVGQLAGGVAHDFNNLLQAIEGNIELVMRHHPIDDDTSQYLSEAMDATERAAKLVRQLLMFSRRETMETESIDLNDLVDGVAKMLRRVIGDDIDISFRRAQESRPICGDPGQIEQVLMTLCVNARDAMPEGGRIVIDVANASLDASCVAGNSALREGEFVRLTVSDSGEGMAPEVIDRMFEPFFTTKEVGKGTGLGLATVYGIVKAHDGLIDVASEPGNGSVFSTYFPVCESTEAATTEAADELPAQGGTETILVAEDSAMVGGLVKKILGGAGYKVMLARDGQEAIQAFDRNAPRIDMVFLDVIMPRASGWKVAHHVRAARPDMPVLFSSAHQFQTSESAPAGTENIELLSKPYRPQALLLKIRQVLDRTE